MEAREVKPLVFRMDHRYWKTAEQIKAMKQEEMPNQFEPPKLIDLEVAERVHFTQQDLDRLRRDELEDELIEEEDGEQEEEGGEESEDDDEDEEETIEM